MTTETQNTPAEVAAPQPGTPEHDAAMAARFDSANQGNVEAQASGTPAERPANVPEKFWDAEKGQLNTEAMLASYAALEAKQGGKAEGAADETPASTEAASSDAAKALSEVGLDYSKYETEFATNGKLSDATYAEMAAKNIPRSVVDAHIQTMTQLAEYEANSIRTSVFSMTGGEDGYKAMAEWSVANLPMAERVAFNNVLDSGNVDAVKLAVQGLFAKYQATQGQEPNLLNGGGGKVSGDVFRSTQELTSAMRDPRYSKDPAFRADVEAKLARSNIM